MSSEKWRVVSERWKEETERRAKSEKWEPRAERELTG